MNGVVETIEQMSAVTSQQAGAAVQMDATLKKMAGSARRAAMDTEVASQTAFDLAEDLAVQAGSTA